VFAWLSLTNRGIDRAEAIRLALAGDAATAEPMLAAVLARDPDDAEAVRALALVRIEAGRLADATEPLERWRALRPDDPEPHLARVDQAARLGRPAEAIDPARAVLALRPNSDRLREQLTYWLYITGRTEEADAECGRCRAVNPTPDLKLLHAEIAYRLGDTARAGRFVDEALANGARTALSLSLRGAVSLDGGDPGAAIPPLREAIKLGGEGQSRARHYLSLALARTGDEAGARQLLAEEQREQAVGLWEKYGRSDGVAYKVAIAEALLATGRPAEATRLLDHALLQDPKCRAAHKVLADCYDATGRPAEAAEQRRLAAD
jgi:predicted Zn-dependent protease